MNRALQPLLRVGLSVTSALYNMQVRDESVAGWPPNAAALP